MPRAAQPALHHGIHRAVAGCDVFPGVSTVARFLCAVKWRQAIRIGVTEIVASGHVCGMSQSRIGQLIIPLQRWRGGKERAAAVARHGSGGVYGV